MLVFNSLDDINIDCDTCVTIGNFDGVHKGHQTLMKKAIEYSKINNLKSVVFTFSNHPVNYFIPDHVKNIMTCEEKGRILESLGIDILVNIPFGVEMTKISADEYVNQILVEKLHIKKLIVGHDFTFAKNREGNTEKLIGLGKKYRFDVEIVSPVLIDEKRVSSTDIRKLISEGKVEEVTHLLGRRFALEGTVVKCRQIGRTIGFPTANLGINEDIVIPQIGIYATVVYLGDSIFLGATSIGTNPTVEGKGISVETYILDFDEEIYGQNMRIEFAERFRDEIKFDGIEGLKLQLQKDVKYVRSNREKYLSNNF